MGNIFQKPGQDVKSKDQQMDKSVDDRNTEKSGDAGKDQSEMYRWVYTNKLKAEKVYYDCEFYNDEDKKATYIIGFGDCAVFIIEPNSGTLVWKHELKKNLAYSGPGIVYKGVIYAVTKNGVLQALSIAGKSMLWEKNIDAPVKFSPVAGENLVFVATQKDSRSAASGRIFAFSSENGSQKWEKELLCTTPLILKQNRIYLKGFDGFIYALNTDRGETLWKRENIAPQSQLYMVVVENNIFVGENENIYSLNAVNGNVIWRFKTQIEICPDIIYNDKLVFVMTNDGFIYALDCNRGTLMWKYQLAILKNVFEDYCIKPAICKKDLVISRNDYLYILKTDNGKLKWNKSLNNFNTINVPRPILLPGYTIFSDGLKSLNIVNTRKMKTLWVCDIDKTQGNIVAMQRKEAILYVMSSTGSIFMVNLEGVIFSLEKEPPSDEIYLDTSPIKCEDTYLPDDSEEESDETVQQGEEKDIAGVSVTRSESKTGEAAPESEYVDPLLELIDTFQYSHDKSGTDAIEKSDSAGLSPEKQSAGSSEVSVSDTSVKGQIVETQPAREPSAGEKASVRKQEPSPPETVTQEPGLSVETISKNPVERIEELPDELPSIEIDTQVISAESTQKIAVEINDFDDLDKFFNEVDQGIRGIEKPAEISKETQEAIQIAPQEIIQVAPQEVLQEEPQEAIQGALQEFIQEALQEVTKEPPQELIQEAPQEVIQEAPQEVMQEAPKEVIK